VVQDLAVEGSRHGARGAQVLHHGIFLREAGDALALDRGHGATTCGAARGREGRAHATCARHLRTVPLLVRRGLERARERGGVAHTGCVHVHECWLKADTTARQHDPWLTPAGASPPGGKPCGAARGLKPFSVRRALPYNSPPRVRTTRAPCCGRVAPSLPLATAPIWWRSHGG